MRGRTRLTILSALGGGYGYVKPSSLRSLVISTRQCFTVHLGGNICNRGGRAADIESCVGRILDGCMEAEKACWLGSTPIH